MFGYSAEYLIGRSIRTIIPADRQNEEDDVLARIREGVRVDHFETVRMRSDGTHIPISLTVSPIRDSTGTIVWASKIARDISERMPFLAELGKILGASFDAASMLKTVASLSVPRVGDWARFTWWKAGPLDEWPLPHIDPLQLEFDAPLSIDTVVANGHSTFVRRVTDDMLADSAKAALRYVEQARPDVLIVDLGMPEMDGFELIARPRHARNEAVRNVPAAALTASARSEERAKALRTGFQMHLAKPIDLGELTAAVASLARSRQH